MQIIGHLDFFNTFNKAWENKEKYPIHPVWILSGIKGIGKATICKYLAEKLYGNIGDFFLVNLENNYDKQGNLKQDSKTISVYTIRRLIEKLSRFSMSDGFRIIVIDSLDELTEGASNSLLKLLEEPPKKTLFLCVCHKLFNVLPTIRSRARIEKLKPLNNKELNELCEIYLKGESIPEDLIKISNGSFGRIIELYNSGGLDIYNNLIKILNDKKSNSADIKEISQQIAEKKELHNILCDVAYNYNLSELYFEIIKSFEKMNELNLNSELIIYNLLVKIKECL